MEAVASWDGTGGEEVMKLDRRSREDDKRLMIGRGKVREEGVRDGGGGMGLCREQCRRSANRHGMAYGVLCELTVAMYSILLSEMGKCWLRSTDVSISSFA
jgi:hypothetical protein